MTGDDAVELLAAFERLSKALESPRNNGNAITVHAGGAAVWVVAWVAGLSCAFMLGATIVGAFWVSNEFERTAQERASIRADVNASKAYLSAIYQLAPHLKPEEKTDER